ncbi:dephospho-CoA kinase [Pseudoluteimonas lycopersici]|uniref:Dephospho-CoA kinase n=1 Tax=Pseudoluteimonas lycopersici TaxID=1324796 RepID=A0A516V7K0_9GAMM|nr:dephospho-CoA kinase [Lysobacter lycopersici]QDQ74507.1 dephospho-CoA kinase [Lysobacter lycopersici]
MSTFVIGLTGGVASGKSEVARRFEALGIVVADADIAARAALAPGSDGLAETVAAFGNDILAADGGLDRAAMRRRVFADDAARRRLEAIVHPRVRAALEAQCRAASSAYAVAAIPLLAEGGGRTTYPWLSRILVVDVPEAVQLQRLQRRDGIDSELAAGMLAAQASRRERLAIADDVIANDGPLDALDEQVAALDRRYRALAG